MCGADGEYQCEDCRNEFVVEGHQLECIHFCKECNEKAHNHQHRVGHHTQHTEQEAGAELELLSVICIETSHYVCFSRSGDRWVFMDSMADRIRESKSFHNWTSYSYFFTLSR